MQVHPLPPALNMTETSKCHRCAVSMPSNQRRKQNAKKGRKSRRNSNIEAFGCLDGPAWGGGEARFPRAGEEVRSIV